MNSLNSIISNNKVNFGKLINYKSSNPISFKGQLEDDYFKSAKNNDIQGQLSALKNLGFDISEIDLETRSNFLHFAIKSQNDSVISQALLLLSKKKGNPEAVSNIIKQEDSSGKTPCEYVKNETIIKRIERITGTKIHTERIPSEPAKRSAGEFSVKRSIKAQPIPVRIKDPVRTDFGSYLSASGPSIIAPKDMPIYITEIA